MPTQRTASEQIVQRGTSWPGAVAGIGLRGELSIRVGGREIGHLHGNHSAHFGFPRQVWRAWRAQGRIEPHPVFPGSEGAAARRIAAARDVDDVVGLMRIRYELLTANGDRTSEAA